jgi:type VI secretion system secreted protein Hcp
VALNAYLRMAGQIQGAIKGSVTIRGREGTIRVTAADHAVTTPRDAASGLATGKRQHGQYTITKDLDASTPRLYSAWARNEAFTTWELLFFEPTATGVEVQHYTVRLTGAAIAKIRFEMPDVLDPAGVKLPLRETISFTYGKIEWLWTAGAVTATDSWSAP